MQSAAEIIVIDDASPEVELSTWLNKLAEGDLITLHRNSANVGFVSSANRGMDIAGRRNVVLLNSDTEVPPGWLQRLVAHAHRVSQVATISPFSNNATICGYPSNIGGPLPPGQNLHGIDRACQVANAGRNIEIPTSVGFCMFIARTALDEVGYFDEQAFGRGYGEENDFCMRAAARGWKHLLACDVFVYHEGAVSFSTDSETLSIRAMRVLIKRYPQYPQIIERHVRTDLERLIDLQSLLN